MISITKEKPMKPKILCIDDDKFIRKTIKNYLEKELFDVLEAENSTEVRNILSHSKEKIDLVLLDLVLPDQDGIDLMREIKSISDMPIIIISSRDEEIDRIIGIETGADDYLTKPFSPREVKARINAVLKRYQADKPINEDRHNNKLTFDNWTIRPSQYQAYNSSGNSANLTTQEFLILKALIDANGATLKREILFDIGHDINSETYDRAVDIQITRIRKKLGDSARNPKYIRTVRGIGYLFCCSINNN